MIDRSLPEETVFARALEIESAAERAAFLDRACGDNPTLRAEVEALLRADDARAGDLLDLPERSTAALGLPGVERPGAAIGPYALVREIGEGGIGVVWLAEQAQPVRRRVALKIIEPGTADSRALVISRGDEFGFWDVATLRPIYRLHRDFAQSPGPGAFSPDGRLMALEMSSAVIHLRR